MWTEVNARPRVDQRLVLELVGPFVREHRALLDRWFWFWEPGLRWRLRWVPGCEEQGRAALEAALEAAVSSGLVTEWWEGNHGRRGQVYAGEADSYGAEVWELVCADWTSGAELALALLEAERDGTLTKPLSFHWSRRVHLFSNPLLLDEIGLCLHQGRRYLELFGSADPEAPALMAAVDRHLAVRRQ